MPHSHHRKTHKEHLKSFKHKSDSPSASKSKSSASTVIMIVGALAGFAIGYFATGEFIWMTAGLLIGAIGGFYIGKKIDDEA